MICSYPAIVTTAVVDSRIMTTLVSLLSLLLSLCYCLTSYDSRRGRCLIGKMIVRGGLANRGEVGHWLCLIQVMMCINR